MQPKIKLTIDRSKWGIGQLYNSDNGRMCALGFLGQKLGVPLSEMDDLAFPAPTAHWKDAGVFRCVGDIKVREEAAVEVFRTNDNVREAIDDGRMTPEQGERALRDALERLNVEVDFCGEYWPLKD